MTKKSRKAPSTKNKITYSTDDINVNNILVFKKEPYGNKKSFKYFIGYNDSDIIRPICIRLSEMTGYVTKFDVNATMSIIVNDKQLLKKDIKI